MVNFNNFAAIPYIKIMLIQKNWPLIEFNTFGFNVTASEFISITDIDQLAELFDSHQLKRPDIGILGGGSNITFTINFEGLLLRNEIVGKTTVQETNEFAIIEFGGGESWHEAVLHALSLNLGGIENLSLIPGTVGAAPIQNIGAYGVELKDVFHSLSAFHLPSGEIHHFDAKACEFGYRDSIFKREKRGQYFIVSVQLKLSKNAEIKTQYGDIQATLDGWGIGKPTIHDISKAVIQIRESKLPNPAEIGNCGSFFKNPVVSGEIIPALRAQFPDIKTFPAGTGLTKVPAGWLIEKAGWKGFRRGDVGVHAKQALVLVNYGNGTGQEVIDLAHEIQADVLSKFGIALEMEVNAW